MAALIDQRRLRKQAKAGAAGDDSADDPQGALGLADPDPDAADDLSA